MTEEKAIALCLRHKDPAGFEFLVQQFRREAFFHARTFMGNDADAADACQEAFLNAYRAMPAMKALDRFYPWFYRILRNVCINMLRRRKTRNDYSNAQQEKQNQTGSRALDESAPDAMAVRREEAQQVWAMLDELSAEHREILTLKYIHGFRYDEIAATLDIPRGTVMSRLYSARNAFRLRYTKDHSQSRAK